MPNSLMLDIKRLHASSRRANSVGKAQFRSGYSYEQSGNMILGADFSTPSTNGTRQAGNAAHTGGANSNMGCSGYNKPE